MKRTLKNNLTLIYLMAFCQGFMVVIPVFVPLLQGFDLSMSEILQTQAVFAITIAVCEVPSGYIADIWGRRRAILVGSAINAVGFVGLLWADSFVDFVIYEVVLGVGISLLSGADLALLYDTNLQLEHQGEEGQGGSQRAVSRLIAVETAASGLAGLGASVLLWLGDMQVLLWVQAVTGLLPALLALGLVEAPIRRSELPAGSNAADFLRLFVYGRPVVLWTTLAIVCFGLISLYSFWLYQKQWQLQGIPSAGFGVIWALFAVVTSLAARYAAWFEQWLGWRRMLLVTAILPLLGWTGMALLTGLPAIASALAIQVCRGFSLSLFYEALNRRVPGHFRATVNSLASLGVRAVFIVTGPLLGLALDRYGMTPVLLGLVAIFAPLIVALTLGLRLRINREYSEVVTPPLRLADLR